MQWTFTFIEKLYYCWGLKKLIMSIMIKEYIDKMDKTYNILTNTKAVLVHLNDA